MLDMEKVKSFDDQALQKKIADTEMELTKLRFQRHTAGLEKPHMLRALKKDIARLKTVQNQRGKQS